MTLEAPFPTGTKMSVSQVTDWVEFTALSRRSAYKQGDLKSVLAIENVDKAELLEQQVWAELARRADLHGNNWPLALAGPRLTRKIRPTVSIDLYRFLCCLGMGLLDPVDRQLFELIVTELMPALSGFTSLHIGAPASVGMDPSFRKRVATYTAASQMLSEEIRSQPLPDDKDLGVDVVTWAPFLDKRSGYLHYLAQCATGEDWREKTLDIYLPVLENHLGWGVTPIRAFAVPFTIVLPDAQWVRLCSEAGLVLDRPRLLELSTYVPASPQLTAKLRARVKLLAA